MEADEVSYIELWSDELRRVDPGLGRALARMRVQAVFGLLNSTPHSARRALNNRQQLVQMALRSLGP